MKFIEPSNKARLTNHPKRIRSAKEKRPREALHQ